MSTTALPLDIDLNSIDTSFPLIADGSIVDFQVTKIEKQLNKSNVEMLAIELTSTTPTKSVKGDDLAPGQKVFHNINLGVSGKATVQMVAANIGEYAQAIGLTGTLGDFIGGSWASTQGMSVRAKVGYTPEGPDKKGVHRKARNEITSFLKSN